MHFFASGNAKLIYFSVVLQHLKGGLRFYPVDLHKHHPDFNHFLQKDF